jgi:hypothetical protein
MTASVPQQTKWVDTWLMIQEPAGSMFTFFCRGNWGQVSSLIFVASCAVADFPEGSM